jgi:hypothetical protein
MEHNKDDGCHSACNPDICGRGTAIVIWFAGEQRGDFFDGYQAEKIEREYKKEHGPDEADVFVRAVFQNGPDDLLSEKHTYSFKQILEAPRDEVVVLICRQRDCYQQKYRRQSNQIENNGFCRTGSSGFNSANKLVYIDVLITPAQPR